VDRLGTPAAATAGIYTTAGPGETAARRCADSSSLMAYDAADAAAEVPVPRTRVAAAPYMLTAE
jgi:hypothetical protein